MVGVRRSIRKKGPRLASGAASRRQCHVERTGTLGGPRDRRDFGESTCFCITPVFWRAPSFLFCGIGSGARCRSLTLAPFWSTAVCPEEPYEPPLEKSTRMPLPLHLKLCSMSVARLTPSPATCPDVVRHDSIEGRRIWRGMIYMVCSKAAASCMQSMKGNHYTP